jgi:small subunit ribosomal protein S6e
MAVVEEVRVNVSDPKTGKSYNKVMTENVFLNRKLGETIQGNLIGLDGYELKITGGSDDSGFPMRKEIDTAIRKKPILSGGVGFNVKKRRKQHDCKHHFHLTKRKTVRGNTISDQTAQINLSVVKAGAQALDAVFGAKEDQEKPAEGQ